MGVISLRGDSPGPLHLSLSLQASPREGGKGHVAAPRQGEVLSPSPLGRWLGLGRGQKLNKEQREEEKSIS